MLCFLAGAAAGRGSPAIREFASREVLMFVKVDNSLNTTKNISENRVVFRAGLRALFFSRVSNTGRKMLVASNNLEKRVAVVD
jgi:hypothetical protein